MEAEILISLYSGLLFIDIAPLICMGLLKTNIDYEIAKTLHFLSSLSIIAPFFVSAIVIEHHNKLPKPGKRLVLGLFGIILCNIAQQYGLTWLKSELMVCFESFKNA